MSENLEAARADAILENMVGEGDDGKVALRAIAAAVIGNLFEWYDFAVYGFFAAVIGKQFFPTSDPSVSLLLSFATFGIGFLARPLGAVTIGTYGDRHGRRKALMLTMFLMAIGTGALGLLPTYNEIGLLAPVLLIAVRLMQGLSVGGESGGSIAFIVEYAPTHKRGMMGGLQQSTLAGGLLMGSLAGALLAGVLSTAQLEDWGWRLPFLAGVLIAPVGLYLRARLDETPAFKEVRSANAIEHTPLRVALITQWRKVLQGGGIALMWSVAYYICFTYLPTYAVKEIGFSAKDALLTNACALVLVIVLSPTAGAWSDRIGRKPLLLASTIIFAVLTYPLLLLVQDYPKVLTLSAVQLCFAVALSLYNGPAPAAVAEIFSTSTRYTGVSVGINISATVFGGFAPLIATFMIGATGQKAAPSYFLVFCALLTFITVVSLRESFGRRL